MTWSSNLFIQRFLYVFYFIYFLVIIWKLCTTTTPLLILISGSIQVLSSLKLFYHQRMFLNKLESMFVTISFLHCFIIRDSCFDLSARLRITRPWVRAPLEPTCLCPWARYLILMASLTWAHQGGIGRGKYYNHSADKVCPWPTAPLGEVKWLWRFSWYSNNRQQRFVSSGKRCYTNADIIYLLFYYLFNY